MLVEENADEWQTPDRRLMTKSKDEVTQDAKCKMHETDAPKLQFRSLLVGDGGWEVVAGGGG